MLIDEMKYEIHLIYLREKFINYKNDERRRISKTKFHGTLQPMINALFLEKLKEPVINIHYLILCDVYRYYFIYDSVDSKLFDH